MLTLLLVLVLFCAFSLRIFMSQFYDGFEKWSNIFGEDDRKAYEDVFTLPDGVYEVSLQKPLGIVFEELDSDSKGLYVLDLVEGGNAQRDGRIQKGDLLVAITAVKIVGAKYERRLIPCRKFDFDTMVGAVESNDRKFGCNDVIMMFERPPAVAIAAESGGDGGEGDVETNKAKQQSAKVDEFLSFFEPPFDNPWKQRQ